MSTKGVIHDLSDPREKRKLLGWLVERVARFDGLTEIRDEPAQIVIKRRRPTRTLRQNAYYWAVVIPWVQDYLAEEWGDPDLAKLEAHEEMKRQFLSEERVRVDANGEVLRTVRIKRTPDCDTAEFGQFVDKVIDFLARWSPERYQAFLREQALYSGELEEGDDGQD